MATLTNGGERQRARSNKYDERRAELVDSALRTLSELGYARTSVRDIAQNSEFSHGVLHYYFADKSELIVHCIQRYRDLCVARFDEIELGGPTRAAYTKGMLDGIVATLEHDAPMHRLWYDLRAQAMYEAQFQPFVTDITGALEKMVWRLLERYGELNGSKPTIQPAIAYAMLDGVFESHLVRFLAGETNAPKRLRAAVVDALAIIVPT